MVIESDLSMDAVGWDAGGWENGNAGGWENGNVMGGRLDSDEEIHNEQPVWMELDERGVVAYRGDGLFSNHQGH